MPTKTSATKKVRTKRVPSKRRSTKTAPVAEKVVQPTPKVRSVKRTYLFAVGRRKAAIARVRWHRDGEKGIIINRRALEEYFPIIELQTLVRAPLEITHMQSQGGFTVRVIGGGSQGQAEAVRLGIARTLVQHDSDLRIPLKRAGFLRRDPRVKERKKYGLKRARRAPQWQKR